MPTTVRKQITVTELRAGDTLDETPPAVVESLTRKTTWGVIAISGEAKPRRLRLDAAITVLRQEPTPEEQARTQRAYTVQLLRGELSGWLERDPAQLLQHTVDKYRGCVEVLTSANLADVLRAQALFKHARDMCGALGQPDDLTTVDEDTLLRVFACWWYDNIHDRSGPRHDPISRSTNAISNLLEDCDDWAIEKIRSRIIWAGAREELERRVAHMLAARDARR